MCSDEAAMASIKVFDPVSVPLSVLEELQQLRAQVEGCVLRKLERLVFSDFRSPAKTGDRAANQSESKG